MSDLIGMHATRWDNSSKPGDFMLVANAVTLPQIPESDVLAQTIASLAEQMIVSMDTSRKDRLWPADAMVFQTNALNLAYGACGTALFLHDALGELPAVPRDWLMAQPIDNVTYPPGLYSGIAGIAWCFAEMGMLDRAVNLFELIPQSPLAFKTAEIFSGVAGWGLAALALHLKTGDEQFRSLACQAGDHLLKTAKHTDLGASWPDENDDVPLGFALGGSGIAVFLLYLWYSTKEDRYLQVAREALEFDLAYAKNVGDTLLWGASVESRGHRPYWLRGGAGVASALIRFAQMLNDDRYRDLACRAVRPCTSFFSAAPHLFEGLASMGESLLDVYQVTGDEFYLEKARQKATQTLLYSIERPQGIAFPGRYLFKISHDYGVGGAGIGLFLHRLIGLRPRRLHDIFPGQATGKGGHEKDW
jgi:rhamnogalacturonyl hydrolase YesR